MKHPQVAVTGFAINSALGTDIESNLAALQKGQSGIVSIREKWELYQMRSLVAGNIHVDGLRTLFDRKHLRFMCEPALLVAAATKQAIQHAGLSDEEVHSPETGIIFGTGAGASATDVYEMCDRLRSKGAARLGAYYTPIIMGSSPTANVGSIFGIQGHSYSITSACSTSAHAIMLGMDTIRLGRQKRMLVGGAEDINPFSASSFDGMNALSTSFNEFPERSSRPLDRDRDGFVFSGGAGVLVLEDLDTARRRGATIHAIIAGAGASCDGEKMVAPNGFGAERSMRLALADAQISPDQVDYINLHGTSTPLGDMVELHAIKRVFGDKVPPFSSTKSMTGHGLGAAGAHEAIFCILMIQHCFLAPNINLDNPDPALGALPIVRETQSAKIRYALTNSFGFGGTNCSLVITEG
jgi:3-oxoacyl-[acyl-carrier-protein] synthase I